MSMKEMEGEAGVVDDGEETEEQEREGLAEKRERGNKIGEENPEPQIN